MTIIRSPRIQRDFMILSNSVCLDKRLTMRALGVLVRILCRPDNWRTNSEALAAEFGCGRDAVRGALQELQDAGYLQLQRTQGAGGRWSSAWLVFEEPQAVTPRADESQQPPAKASPPTTEDGFSGVGETGVGKPEAGETDAGKPGAITRTDGIRTDETRTEGTRVARPRAAAVRKLTEQDLAEEGVEKLHAEAWLAIRKEKRLPLTAGAWDLTKKAGDEFGLSAAQVVTKCVELGWAAFRADWYRKTKQGAGGNTPQQSTAKTSRHTGFGSTNYREGISDDGHF